MVSTVIAAGLAASAIAQPASKQPAPKVTFRYQSVGLPKPSNRPADTFPRDLIVHVEIQEGWHINSEAPLDSFLVPTTLDIKAEGLVFGRPEFPKPELKHSDVMGGDLSLYTGAFDVRVPVTPRDPSVKTLPTPRTRVTLNYQACNNSMCLPPKSVTVEQ
jgi:hypothetical protein